MVKACVSVVGLGIPPEVNNDHGLRNWYHEVRQSFIFIRRFPKLISFSVFHRRLRWSFSLLPRHCCERFTTIERCRRGSETFIDHVSSTLLSLELTLTIRTTQLSRTRADRIIFSRNSCRRSRILSLRNSILQLPSLDRPTASAIYLSRMATSR